MKSKFEETFEKIKFSALNIKELKQWFNSPGIGICPYHYTKFVMNQVDLVLAPYNYVTSPQIRKNMGIDIKDAVIIFDEAHNLEDVSE